MNDLQWLLKQQAAMITNLQNQQATAAAQNPAPIPAPVPAPAPAPRPLKVHVAKPPDFDGNDYDTFKQAIGFYLLVAHQDFTIEQDQILFVLSHMKGGHTSTWA